MNTVTPEKVGLSSRRLQRINDTMQRYIDENKYAGFITMIARRGQIAHFECFGMTDIDTKQPMQPDTIVRIYSMSKPITSVAAMMLYEEGGFQLDDPISKFIPAFKNTKILANLTETGMELTHQKREMTIRHLLTHTSGLSYGFEEDPIDVMYRETMGEIKFLQDFDFTLAGLAQKLAHLPLAHQPGNTWHYSFSTDMVGYLVEVLSGLSFDAFLEQRIFEPLGMVDTGFYVPQEKAGRLAAMYGPAETGGLELIDAPATSPYLKLPNLLSGGGGLVSTASDYMRFAQMLLNKGELDGTRLLGRKTVELMTMNHLPNELLPFGFDEANPLRGYGFGLGFSVVMDVAQTGIMGSEGVFSWGGAASTDFWVDPKEELIGLLMPQFMPNGHYPVAQDFKVLTYQAIVD